MLAKGDPRRFVVIGRVSGKMRKRLGLTSAELRLSATDARKNLRWHPEADGEAYRAFPVKLSGTDLYRDAGDPVAVFVMDGALWHGAIHVTKGGTGFVKSLRRTNDEFIARLKRRAEPW